MADIVHLLWFIQEQPENDDVELLIGVYASENDTLAAIDRLKDKPGFVDFPDGFQVHSQELGKDAWIEGFVRD